MLEPRRYGWAVAGEDTDPIVLTVPPGTFYEVGLGGSNEASGVSLNRGLSFDGQPCGTVFQDPLQGLPVSGAGDSNIAVRVLPSAIPSGLYCDADTPHPTTETTAGDTTSQYKR
jgi:hypothetical protein